MPMPLPLLHPSFYLRWCLTGMVVLIAVSVTACGDDDEAKTEDTPETAQVEDARPAPAQPARRPAPAQGTMTASATTPSEPAPAPVTINRGLRWNGTSSDEGVGLTLFDGNDTPVMTLSCLRNPARFGVAAPTLAMTPGSSSVTLGVDTQAFNFSLPDNTTGLGPGVHGRGDIPTQLLTAMDNDSMGPRELRINYGSQQLGPYLPPNPTQLIDFVTECRGIASTSGTTAS